MKRMMLMLFVLLLGTFLLLGGCGNDDDDPFDPTDIAGIDDDTADWLISFNSQGREGKTDYMVMAVYLGNSADITAADVATVKINGQTLTWTSSVAGFYHCMHPMNNGEEYEVVFLFNNVEKARTDIRMPYPCSANFPATWNPAQSTSFDWTMSGNNQYQVAGGRSMSQNDSDEYSRSIAPSARSFTVPGGQVDLYGVGSYYMLFVDQLSFKLKNRIAFMAWQGEEHNYGGTVRQRIPEELLLHSKDLYRAIR